MFCILAFLIFLILYPILGIFSKDYRILFRKSWECVVNRVTMKPCDVNLGQEIRGKLLGKVLFKYPAVAKFLDRTGGFWAFLFVVLSVWSLIASLLAGLNLWVYDTCEPVSGEGCSLSGEACGVSQNAITLQQALEEGKIGQWAAQPWTTLGNTLQRVPDRLKNWKAEDYLTDKPTYYSPYSSTRQTAVEFIDPGCKYCKKLFENIKQAGFEQKYNLTYTVYPIPDSKTSTGYKFQASYTIATYLEAVKDMPLAKAGQTPADWLLLEQIFTGSDQNGTYQEQFNFTYTKDQIPGKIEALLKELGYSDGEVVTIRDKATSQEIKNRLSKNKDIVENKLKTIKIPTIIFSGRRYDRVVDVDTLKK